MNEGTWNHTDSLLAHGIAGRQDLPIPFSYAMAGAVLALLVSFLALGLLWREPRLDQPGAGHPLDRLARVVDARGTRIALRLLGLLAFAYTATAALAGPDLATNPTPYVVYVLFWIGLVPASVLLGPVWRALNPLRSLHRGLAALLRTDAREGLLPLPARVGYWPTAVGLFAFVWLELAAPNRATLPVLRLWFASYLAVHLVAAGLYGARWFDRGDAFEAYSSLLASLSPWARTSEGRLVARNPLRNAAAVLPAPGLAAVVLVLLGSTAFDSLSNSPAWLGLVQGSSIGTATAATLGLLATVGLVALAYGAAVRLSGRLALSGRPADPGVRELPARFAPTVLPVALGYLVAHYYSLFVLDGQQALIYLSDPLSRGWNLLGLTGRQVDSSLVTPTGVAALQVAAIVAGHVLGVILAHDRAVSLFPRRRALLGQLPLLALMVGYTVTGLLLLFAG